MIYFKIFFFWKMFIIADLVSLSLGVVVFDRFSISRCKVLGLFKSSNFSFNLMYVKILCIIYCTKVKTLHLICLPIIYKMMQVSKTNDGVFECCHEERHASQFNVTGAKFSGCKLVQKSQFRPSEINFQPSPTAGNGNLKIRQPEMSRTYHKCVLIVQKIN